MDVRMYTRTYTYVRPRARAHGFHDNFEEFILDKVVFTQTLTNSQNITTVGKFPAIFYVLPRSEVFCTISPTSLFKATILYPTVFSQHSKNRFNLNSCMVKQKFNNYGIYS